MELYSTEFRSYDPQLGRFHQLDALSEYSANWSPYSFVQNNPIRFNDPLGLDTLNATNKKTDGGETVYTGTNAEHSIVLKPGHKQKTEESKSSGTGTATKVIQGMVLVLAADDATGIGVIDDVAIPVFEVVNGGIILWDC